MKKLILLVSLILASCGTLPNNFTVVRGTSQPATERPTPTASQIPTPTLNYGATEQVIAQQQTDNINTANAMSMLLLAPTQTAEANAVLLAQAKAQEAQANAQAEQKKFDTAAMIYSGNQTAQTYQQTAIPLTVQAQKTNVPLIAAMLEATAQAPRNAQLLAAAEVQRKTWWVLPMFGIFACMLLLGLLVYMFRRGDRPKAGEEEIETPEGLQPIPMKETADNPNVTIRAVIPCEPWRLLLLAEGIVNQNKTLAFNQWTGTPVYKTLKDVREYLMQHDLAYELNGKGGEMELHVEGVEFMQDTIALGEPPAPHKCADLPSPTMTNAQ